MAEENQNKYETPQSSEVEVQDRGVFDFLGKKKEEEKPQEEVIVTEFEKVTVSEEKKEEEGEKKHSLLEKLHRSDSSSSSVSFSVLFLLFACKIYVYVCKWFIVADQRNSLKPTHTCNFLCTLSTFFKKILDLFMWVLLMMSFNYL